jgi:hypothetical protein
MYSSTMDELFNLYALLSVGGKIIIDDWYPQHSATRRNTEQRVALQHSTACIPHSSGKNHSSTTRAHRSMPR